MVLDKRRHDKDRMLDRREHPLTYNFKFDLCQGLGLLVDSEIVLSIRYGKTRVFINKTLSTETTYQQDLINRDLLTTRLIRGKVGPGMWCVKFNSISKVLVCETQMKVFSSRNLSPTAR